RKSDLVKNKIFEDILKIATVPIEDDTLVNKAYKRYLTGYPPISSPHIGDQIVWEIILRDIHDDIIIVSNDKDWADQENKNEIHPYLKDELYRKEKKKIELIKS